MGNGTLSKPIFPIVVLILTILCLSTLAAANVPAESPSAAQSYGKLPIAFEANEGQTDPKVKYTAKGQGYTLFLTPQEFVLGMVTHNAEKDKIKVAAVRIKFVSSDTKTITGVDELEGKSNYFIGNDPQKWRTNVPTYQKVRYEEIYHGIDLVVYGNQRQIEYDFVVAPHADYKQISFRVEGAKTLKTDNGGNLIIAAAGGKMLMHKPLVYQETDGLRQEIKGRYALGKGNLVSFNVAAYDKDKALVIDPTLAYSTYLGGSNSSSYGDRGNGIAVDSSGNAYVVGYAYSTDFPTTTGAYQTTLKANPNAFITKLNATGTALVYSTYLGGSGSGGSSSYGDTGNAIAVDSSGNAYITGAAYSRDFPVTTGAYQTTLKGSNNAYITKLNAAGNALVYSTLIGGSNTNLGDSSYAIAVDSSGNAYITGTATSTDFPTTTGAFQTTLFDRAAFVTKLNADGTALVYSTLLGGHNTDYGWGIAVDSSGNAYVTGMAWSTDFPTTTGAFQTTQKGSNFNGFITKLNASGTALVYSTYLGGNSGDYGYSIAVDASGNAYVSGTAYSSDFPTTTGAFQTTLKGRSNAFITKLNTSGTALVYSTLLGGSSGGPYADEGNGIAVDSSGNAYITGTTSSTDFPVTTGAFQSTLKGATNAFITKLNSTGTALVYSTFLGGSISGNLGDTGSGIAIDSSGDAYVTGFAKSTDFPTTTGAFQTTLKGAYNTFITKLSLSSPDYYYKLSVSKSGSGTITSSPSGISCGLTCSSTYTSGTSVTLTATAGAGSAFSGWTGCDSTSSDQYQCTVNMSSAKTVTATFTSSSTTYILTTSKTGTGTGTITSSPSGLNCVSNYTSCTWSYTSGTWVTLTPTPDNNSVFSGWSGCDSTSGSQCIVTMSAAKTVTATFTASSSTTYALTVTKSGTGSGTVTPSSGAISWSGSTGTASYTAGQSVTLTAAAASGSAFSGWSGCDTSSGTSCTVAMSANKFVTATFTASTTTYALTAAKTGTGTGTITSSPSGISCGSNYISCSWSYASGTSVTLMATPDNNSVFSGWSGCDTSSGTSCTVAMSSAKTVTATFTSSGASDSATARAAINAIYSEYASWFGTTSGSLYVGTSGSTSYYCQWFTNGAALVAWTDGTIYTYYNGTWYSLGVSWQLLGKAATGITAIYNQYTSWFGTTSGSIYIGTYGSASYYCQWFTNGAALVAWTDGTMLTYYNGTWYNLGVNWK
ncbi:MAG: SBBP repeat-containing protein [Nitrospirae bacterium]|nr:SBBP repeat-containing protein [Nitrospirota bacterium]